MIWALTGKWSFLSLIPDPNLISARVLASTQISTHHQLISSERTVLMSSYTLTPDVMNTNSPGASSRMNAKQCSGDSWTKARFIWAVDHSTPGYNYPRHIARYMWRPGSSFPETPILQTEWRMESVIKSSQSSFRWSGPMTGSSVNHGGLQVNLITIIIAEVMQTAGNCTSESNCVRWLFKQPRTTSMLLISLISYETA